MSDRDFQQVGNVLGKKRNVIQAQIMSGVDTQSKFVCKNRGFPVIFNPFLIAFPISLCIRFRLEFNSVRSGSGGTFNQIHIRIQKNRGPYVISLKFFYYFL